VIVESLQGSPCSASMGPHVEAGCNVGCGVGFGVPVGAVVWVGLVDGAGEVVGTEVKAGAGGKSLEPFGSYLMG